VNCRIAKCGIAKCRIAKCWIANCGIANCGIANCSMQWTTVKIAVAGIVELRTVSSWLPWKFGSGIAHQWQCTTEKIAIVEKRISASGLPNFFKVADQREVEALFLNSGPAEMDYGKNSGCPPLNLTIVTNTLMKRIKRKPGDDNKQGRTLWWKMQFKSLNI
jgi:hypothetical protein